jgi:D-tyrosyl-tRNA(Tyr) deacylase
MRIVIQRVSKASVKVDGQIVGAIQQGLLVLVGIENEDIQADADWLLGKLLGMRIFSDEQGKMNLSVLDINGEILVISQFTLHASTKKGNRPSFIKAAQPEKAIPLYNYFIEQLEGMQQKKVQRGIFGADMKVSLVNDGPVTIMMDSKQKE